MRVKMTNTTTAIPAHHLLRWPLLAGLLLLGKPAWAAPEEIQVYMDEMGDKGEFGLDVHLNYVRSGSAVPGYPGAQAPRHVFRVTPEFSYGLTPNLELGLYVLTSRDTHGNSTVDGQTLRLKCIDLNQLSQTLYAVVDASIKGWDINFGVGRGFSSASDRRVLKAVVSVPFGN